MTKELKTLMEKGTRKVRRELIKLEDNSDLVERDSDLYYAINSIVCMVIRLEDTIDFFTEEEEETK